MRCYDEKDFIITHYYIAFYHFNNS